MSKFFYSGTDVEVPSQDMARAVSAGEVETDQAGPVLLQDPGGNRIEVPVENLTGIGNYLARGFRVEGAAETASIEDRLEARHSPVTAMVEAGVRGATMGLSDVVADVAGADDYLKRAALRREELGSGLANTIEIAGGAIPALASGGSSLAAATPAGLLARGAAAVGASAERSALAAGARGGVAKVLGMATEGALDGALSNMGMALSEASLGNVDVNAEYLVSSGAMGALFGGGLGGLFGLAASRGSKAEAIADRIRAETGGEVLSDGAKAAGRFKFLPDSLTDAVARKLTDIGSASSGVDPKLIRELYDNPSLRADIINSDAIETGINKELRDTAQSFLNARTYVKQLFNGEVKKSNLARDIIESESAGNAAIQAAEEAFAPYIKELDDMSATGLLSKADHKRFTDEIGLTYERIQRNAGSLKDESGALWKAFDSLEQLKRTADTRRKAMTSKTMTGLAARDAVPRLHKASTELGENMRALLERQDLWGEAGRKQGLRNAALHKALNNSKSFNSLTSGTGEALDADYWDIEKLVLDGDKVDGFVKNLLNPNREFTNDQLKAHLRDVGELYDVLIRNDDVPAEMIEQFRKAGDDAKKMGRIIEEGEKRLGTIGQLKAGLESEKDLGILGKLGVVTQPVGNARTMARLEAISGRLKENRARVRQETQSAVKHIAGNKQPSQLLKRVAVASRVAATRAASAEDRQQRASRMRNIEERLEALSHDATDLTGAIGYQTEEMAQAAPAHAFAVGQKIQQAVDFLRSKLPPAASQPNMLQPHLDRRLWDDVTIDEFESYLRTIEDPGSAVRDLRNGHLTTESVEVLKAVYPNQYNDMRQAAIETVAQHGSELPFNAVVQLSVLLDFNGDPSMTPEYQRILKRADERGAGGQNAQQGGKKQGVPANWKPVRESKSLTDRMSDGLERR